MRAVVFDEGVSFRASHPNPEPGEGECLIRVHLAGVCSTDLQIIRGYMGFRGVLGHEMVGTVEAGSKAWLHKRVACEINFVCRECDMCLAGLAMHCRSRGVMGIVARDGCFADYLIAPEHNLHEIPEQVSDEEAVFIEPLAAAYQVPAQCRVDARSRVTVVGSGRLGLLIAQVLREKGARVTVVGRNRKKLEVCEKLGIQGIHLDDLVARQDHDVVVECTGSPAGLPLALALVRPRGTIVLKSTHAGAAEVDLAPLVINEVNLVGSRCGPFGEAVNALARKTVRVAPLLSKTFPIEEAEKAFAAAASPENLKVFLAINT